MTVSNDPKCRLRAEDAKRLMPADANAGDILYGLMKEHQLQAVTCIRFDSSSAPLTVGASRENNDVLHDWIMNLMQYAVPNDVRRLDAAVIVGVAADGTVDTATWGVDRKACAAIAKWRDDVLFKCVTVVPFQTWFGWGNNGVPKSLTPAELASLTLAQRAYADVNTRPIAA